MSDKWSDRERKGEKNRERLRALWDIVGDKEREREQRERG